MTEAEMRERARDLMEVLRKFSSDQDPVHSVSYFSRQIRRLYGDQGLVSISLRGLEPGCYRVMRFLHQEGVGWEGFTDMMYAGPNAPIHSGGIVGEIIASGEVTLMRNAEITDDPVLGNQLAPYRLIVAVPVFNDGKALNWILYLFTDPHALTWREIEARMMQSNLIGNATNVKRVAKELRDATAWIQREIDDIAAIQRGLLPRELPALPGIDMAAMYETFDRAGGDFYDTFPLPPALESQSPRLGVFIADASGHGPSAAVVVAMLAVLLRSCKQPLDQPGAVLDYLSHHLLGHAVHNNFVSAFYAIIDPAGEHMRYACAGHNPPFVREPSGEVRCLARTRNLPLAVVSDNAYETIETPLTHGQTLVLYTDGITEARAPDGAFLEETGVIEILRQADGSAGDTLDRIVARLREHEAGGRPEDDQTLLVVRLT